LSVASKIRTIVMKKFLAAFLMAVASTAVSANAQCSSWANTMSIADTIGDSTYMIDVSLANDTEFIFWASASGEVVSYFVDFQGIQDVYGWDEDEKGTGVVSDEFGHFCTISCDGSDGISVTVEAADLPAQAFSVSSTGAVTEVSVGADACTCDGASGTVSRPICTQTACDHHWDCKKNQGEESAWCGGAAQ
jgi:hypothetical protein